MHYGGGMTSAPGVAPDLRHGASPGRPYPSSAKIMGPAWQTAWEVLADGDWHSGQDLVDAMVAAHPVQDRSARNLLTLASGGGDFDAVLEGELRFDPVRHRHVTWYRRLA